MTRGEAWFAHASAALVGGTGLVYGWMRYFAQAPEDGFFAVGVNHVWQPGVQHLHILFAPLLVFGCALIWRDHVWRRVRSGFRPRRRVGLLLVASLVPMIASGYLVQVATDETWQAVWVWTHAISSVVWLLGYAVHQLLPRSGA
ncbi:MAG: hypothetical protein O7B99_09260 [Planctomycetota bacterium]|nr:hypothetical protein [Planctomycetota bacterium]